MTAPGRHSVPHLGGIGNEANGEVGDDAAAGAEKTNNTERKKRNQVKRVACQVGGWQANAARPSGLGLPTFKAAGSQSARRLISPHLYTIEFTTRKGTSASSSATQNGMTLHSHRGRRHGRGVMLEQADRAARAWQAPPASPAVHQPVR